MEYASVLAGESWSDHPACTHPALASLARLVNDCSSDSVRSELAVLVPSVIGLNDDDPRTTVLIAVHAACTALPVAREDRQRALAAGLLCCDRYLVQFGDRADDERTLIAASLELAPGAAKWARDFSANEPAPKAKAIPRICEAMLRISVIGITEACIQDPDSMLRDLLESTIDACIVRMRPGMPVGWREDPAERFRDAPVRQWEARHEALQREGAR
ncbi:MAG: hypothetical protein QOD27_390 [Microbacteriaceae bacterium]|jgi:hypothetical protein|nr:hypothetical protein [Microbacteriaceae bacterium]